MTYEDNDIDKIIDDSGVILFDDKYNSQDQKVAYPAQEKIPLVFNAFGDIFYYKNTQNIWKFSFRELECEVNE